MEKVLRYEKMGTTVISVDITEDYTVFVTANWNKVSKKYMVTLELKEKTTPLKDMIVDETDNIELRADMKTINFEMAKFITKKLDDGFFNYYIDRYNHMLRCFDKGAEMIELETENKVIGA